MTSATPATAVRVDKDQHAAASQSMHGIRPPDQASGLRGNSKEHGGEGQEMKWREGAFGVKLGRVPGGGSVQQRFTGELDMESQRTCTDDDDTPANTSTSWFALCYDFSLLRTITTSLLPIAPIRLLSTHPIWHTYCALSQLDCRLSPYRLLLSRLLILTHYLWHLIPDWLGLCARPISI